MTPEAFQTNPIFFSSWSSQNYIGDFLNFLIRNELFSKNSNSPLYHMGKAKTKKIDFI